GRAAVPRTRVARPPTPGLRRRSRVFPHAVETTPQTRVDRAPRQVEELGDLAGCVLEDVAQDHDRTVLRREAVDAAKGAAVELRVGRGGHVVAELDLGAQLPCARPVDRAVDHDAVQPWRERTPAVEAVEVAHGSEERL